MPKGNKQSTVFNKVFRSVTADMEGGRGGRSGRGGIGHSCRSGEARRRSGGDYCDCGGGNSSPEVEELELALLADRRVGHGPGCGPATGTTSGDSSAPGAAAPQHASACNAQRLTRRMIQATWRCPEPCMPVTICSERDHCEPSHGCFARSRASKTAKDTGKTSLMLEITGGKPYLDQHGAIWNP